MAATAAPPPAPSAPRTRGDLLGEAVLGKAYDVRLLRRLAGYVAPHKRLLLGWLAFMTTGIALDLAQPKLIAYALGEHILGGHIDALPLDALAFVGLILGQNLSSFCEQWFVQLAGQRTMHDLRLALFDRVLAQRAAFFDRIPVGRLMTRMTNDIESLNEMFAQGAITLVDDAFRLAVIMGIMLAKDVQLSLMVFATVPLIMVLVEIVRRAMRKSFRQIRVRLAAMNAFAQEHLFGIRVLHLLGRQPIAQREYNEINAGHRDAYLLQIRADAAVYALVEAIGQIALATILWWAARRTGVSIAMVPLVVVFKEYIEKFFTPIRDLSQKYAVMQGAMAASERIFQLLDSDELDGDYDGERAQAATRSADAGEPPAVELDDVQFSYGAEPVLRGVTLRVRKGATVAVVGATGSGKSTMIKLLTRLYERTGGAIRLGGVDVRALPLDQLRQRVTVVSQDVTLFAGPLADNISLGKPYTPAQLDAAIARVGLDRALARRGDDLSCRVAERGGNFSAGERQLVAFARALLRDPEVLVLDEATAHVDPQAEELIERGVQQLMAGRTTLVIAHRLSTIRNADLIVVMDKGRIVEQGSHAELVAKGGLYAALEKTFRRQGS